MRVRLTNQKLRKEANVIFTIMMSLMLMHGNIVIAENYLISSASELSNLNSSLHPGDTVFMKAGQWIDQELVFEANGTSAKPIVLAAESKNTVILTGTSHLNIAGEYLVVDGLTFENGYTDGSAVVEFRRNSSNLANHCRLVNTSILNYNPSDKDEDYKWVSVYGAHNRVDHCHFEGKQHSGTTLVVWLNGEPNYTQIDHNYFGARPDLGYNGGETIRIGTSTNSMQESRAIVEFNLFEECDGEIEIISNKSCFNIYRYNTFRDNNGCLTIRHGNDCEVYGNFFLGENKSSGGVRIIGERHKVYNNYFEGLKGDGYRSAICMMNGVPNSPLNRYFQVIEAEVAFNTIVNCKVPFTIGAGKDSEKTLAPKDCKVANNIMDDIYDEVIELDDTPIDMLWEGNVANADADDVVIKEGISFFDPELINQDGAFRLSSGSDAIDAAEGTYDYVQTDIDNEDRDGSKDVGCDEYLSNTDYSRALVKDDVGPYTGDEEKETSITKLIEVNDMVKLVVINNSIKLKVMDPKYLPIQYMMYDITGRTIMAGDLYEEDEVFNLNKLSCYLLSFRSLKGYVQNDKIILSQ
ncbi:polysaccharide lyase 6 family protein [Carboxylicivirga sp. N1Y90]|uniref:polysaccharide lyase 6 family protein n=1 Tax=Carboxylicivirga fragile TaxID=3417571 RepID=UPI003D33DFD6|nr:polysaccharide lyase 6 family protein [Marinilabiliaceae bacterium N1Y90]